MVSLRKIVESFDQFRVLLIGDTIVDIYTYGTALGLSAETPTIVAREREVKVTLGGAALVCRNLLELGAAVSFITMTGDDKNAGHVQAFAAPKLNVLPIVDPTRPTTAKHRFWVDGYKLFQLDTRDDEPISTGMAQRVMQNVESCLPEADLVVISDYRHGLLSQELIGSLLPMLRGSGKPIFVDSQVSQTASNHRLYRGDAVMCLNLKEARCIDADFSPTMDPASFGRLMSELGSDKILVKLGADGALMLDGDQVVKSAADKVEMVDPTGAGDAFLSAFCLSRMNDLQASLRLANVWAGLSVQKHGTFPPDKRDLLAAIDDRVRADALAQ